MKAKFVVGEWRQRNRGGLYIRWLNLLWLTTWAVCNPAHTYGDATADAIQITRPAPDARGGQAYELSYRVNVPLEVFWRFKTDFDNTFVESNPQILDHRQVSRTGDVVITEDRYSLVPDAFFRWRTRILAARHRLEYELINTNLHGHHFHYGTIQLRAEQGGTRVTQIAYFDFWGATIWSKYPWHGGMRSFLKASAEWEQRTAVQLQHLFAAPDDP